MLDYWLFSRKMKWADAERPSRCTTLPWSCFPKINFSWKHFSSLLKQSPARRCGPIVYYSCSVRINILMRLKRDWKEPATAECLSLISLVIHNGLNGFHLANKARWLFAIAIKAFFCYFGIWRHSLRIATWWDYFYKGTVIAFPFKECLGRK